MIASEKIEELKEYLSGYSKYQWLKSERAGNITEFLNVAIEQDGSVMVEFMDGSRCKYELLNEFLLKTNNERELLDVEAPANNNNNNNSDTQKTKVGNASIRNGPVAPDNPIHTLLKKQKPNLVNVDISIEMNIPSSELYNVICQSFDNADEEIVNYIVSGLDIETIKTSVKAAIQQYYKA